MSLDDGICMVNTHDGTGAHLCSPALLAVSTFD